MFSRSRRRTLSSLFVAASASLVLIASSLSLGVASAVAAQGDITQGAVDVSLSDDGAGGLKLGATGNDDDGALIAVETPVRVPSSREVTIPEDPGYSWLGAAGQRGWALGAVEDFELPVVNFMAITWNEDVFYDDRGEPISVPVTWRLKGVVAPEGGAYSAYESPLMIEEGASLVPVESERRFGTGAQRDGTAQGSAFVDPSDSEEPGGPYTQFFTALGMYCVSYEVELTLPSDDTPIVRETTLRYAVGDGVPSEAGCGSNEWVEPEPEPEPEVGEVTLKGQVWHDANQNGIKDHDETVFSGVELVAASGGGWDGEQEYVELTTDELGMYDVRLRTTPPVVDADNPPVWVVMITLPDGFEQPDGDTSVLPSGERVGAVVSVADLSVDGAEETLNIPLRAVEESAAYVLHTGHADVLYPELATDGAGAESLTLRAHVDRVAGVLDYDDMVVHLDDRHKLVRPAEYSDEEDYSFIGPEGSTEWRALEAAEGVLPWIGAAMQSPTLAGLPDNQLFSFSLDAVTGPGGTAAPGDAVMWSGDAYLSWHQKPKWSNRSGEPRASNFRMGTHSHFDWSFTNEGVYCLAFTVQTPGTDGQLLRDSQQLTVVVGSETDPKTVEPCGLSQQYPQRSSGDYLDADGGAPIMTRHLQTRESTAGATAGLRLDGDQLRVESLRWLPDLDGKITANPIEDSLFYTPQEDVDVRHDENPYPVNMPNWDATAIAPGDIRGSGNFTITNVDGPGELTGRGGWGHRTVIDTANGVNSVELWPSSISDDYRWQVTRPGKYCVTGQWSATTAAGENVQTSQVITLVTDGPLDPGDYRWLPKGGNAVSDGEIWRASEHGALEATCAQDPDSWTRASEVPLPDDVPDEPGQRPWNVPNWTKTESGARILNLGHVDVASVLTDGKLDTLIKDTTDEGSAAAGPGNDYTSWHEPEDTVFQLLPDSVAAVPQSAQFRFLGEPGSRIWRVNDTQDSDLLWPGWSTEHIDDGISSEGVDWALTGMDGPGDFFLYQLGLDGPAVHINTADGIDAHDMVLIRPHAHVHGSWAFTAQGVYCLAFERTATINGDAQTDTFTLAVAVGETDPRLIDPANCEGSGQAVTVPSAPAKPVASVEDDAVTVTWTTPDDGGSTLTGYTVQLLGGKQPLIKETTSDALKTVFQQLPPGTYTATVNAVNKVGASPASAPSAPVTVQPPDGTNPDGTNPDGTNPDGTNPDDQQPGDLVTPVPDSELTDANRGGVRVPEAATRDTQITVHVGAAHAGEQVRIWLHSTPALLGTVTLDPAGNTVVTIPSNAELRDHKIVVQTLNGALIGWDNIRIGKASQIGPNGHWLATTGAGPTLPLATGAGTLLLLGTVILLSATKRRHKNTTADRA